MKMKLNTMKDIAPLCRCFLSWLFLFRVIWPGTGSLSIIAAVKTAGKDINTGKIRWRKQ